jgi:hypothetical protein
MPSEMARPGSRSLEPECHLGLPYSRTPQAAMPIKSRLVSLANQPSRAMHFPWCARNEQPLRGKLSGPLTPQAYMPLQIRNFFSGSLWQAACFPSHVLFVFGEVDGESSICGTSFGLDTTSDDLAVRVLRNPMASAPCSSVTLGSCWGSANALWTDAQCPGDRGQFWNDACCGNTSYTSSGEPSVAGSDVGNASTITSRPSVARTV